MQAVQSEEAMSRQLARYLRLKHPELIGLFHFDFGSGLFMTKSQAIRQKLLNDRAWPDFQLAVPSTMAGTPIKYHGLFLELKRDGTRLKKQDGQWASPHIAEQAAQLEALAAQGYVAMFAVGLDEAIELIESYLHPVVHEGVPDLELDWTGDF